MSSCCENSQSVVLFADGDRNNGTEEVIFDTKQSEKIYYFRNFKVITPTTTVVATTQSGNAPSNLSNSVDKDRDTFALYQEAVQTTVVRFDWGTQAVREIQGIMEGFAGVNDVILCDVRFAGSDLVFSSFVDFFDVPQVNVAKITLDMPFGSQDLRYVELELDTTASSGTEPSVRIFEFYDKVEGFGTSDVNIQVKNNITGNFFTADTLSNIPDTSAEVLDTKTTIQPNQSLTRIQLVNNGKWNGSVGALLVNPKFT